MGWAGWLIAHGTPYLTNDAASDPVIEPEVRERLGVRSGMAVPIADSEEGVIGFFEVYNKRGGFTEADVQHGVAAARITSLAIHNRLLRQNLAALAASSQSLAAANDIDQALEAIGRHIEAAFDRRCVILLPLNRGLTPRFCSAEFVFGELELAAASWAWEHGQEAGGSTQIIPAAQGHYLPLKTPAQVVGVLGLENQPGAWFSNMQRQLLSAFISQSAIDVERCLLQQKLRRIRFLEQSEKMQNAVLSAVAHEVRAPLAAITTSLSGLLTSSGNLGQAAERQLLETADFETRRLHRVVNNLLSLTRLEARVSTVKTEPGDLLEAVSAALEELGVLARQRQVSIDIPQDLPLVPMDFGLITAVLVNLLSNAFKYSPPEQPVEVRGRVVNEQLEVLVVDRGIGIAPDDAERVFDKFYRVAKLGAVNGLGLGLAICKEFIEAHHGHIRIESNPAGGTIARFVIPINAPIDA